MPDQLDLRKSTVEWTEAGMWIVVGDTPIAEVLVESVSHLEFMQAWDRLREEPRT